VARGRFLAGGVTFCAMVPMRSIPFQVVCLIGMNDGSFPRARQPLSFDLLAADDAQPGDRSRRDDDRYLFLEAVASARRCLSVSWVGRGVRDNAHIPPSIVVSELLAAVRQGFDAPWIETVHPLQAFSRRYFATPPAPGLVSYSTELCEATRRRGRGRRVRPLVTTRLPDAPAEAFDVDLDRFSEFFVNPTAHLLRERLGIRLAEAAQPVEFREPFCLDAVGRYALRTELLGRWSEPTEPALLLRELRGRGLVPVGRVGEVELAQQRAVVGEFAARVETAVGGEPLGTVPLDVRLDRVRVSGALRDVGPDGLIAFRLAEPKPRDLLALWIRHLLLHVVQPRAAGWQSRWLGTTKGLLFTPVDEADRLLRELAQAFDDGLHRLLPFFPKTARAWCEASDRKRERAREVWEGNDFSDGERTDAWFAYAWREVDPLGDDFEALAARLMAPLVAHCTEPDA
jgi:exodeoxyribonuclease V gamma subunit